MATARTFRVIGVNGATLERGQRVFDKARFIQGIGVNGDLHIVLLSHRQAAINGGRRGAPVFVQLQPHHARFDLLNQTLRQAGIALAQQTKVHRQVFQRLIHALDIPTS